MGTGPPESLESLLEPKYEGKFAIGDDGNTVIIMIARLLGLGGDTPGLLTEDELDQVFDKLEEFRDASFGVMANPYAEYAGAYTRGEIIAAFPDNAPTALRAREADIPVEVHFPPGVGWSWIDALFIRLGRGAHGRNVCGAERRHQRVDAVRTGSCTRLGRDPSGRHGSPRPDGVRVGRLRGSLSCVRGGSAGRVAAGRIDGVCQPTTRGSSVGRTSRQAHRNVMTARGRHLAADPEHFLVRVERGY